MSISTLTFNTASRTSLLRLQSQVSDSLQEVNTGRHTDVGRTLGRLTGSAISARAQESSFKEQKTSNGLVSARLNNIDASLASISEGAETLANNLLGSGVTTSWGTVIDLAKSGLQQLTGALNASSGGQYLFGGDNTDVVPISAYDGSAPISPSDQAKNSFQAFLTAAGKTPATVTAAEIKDYLTTGYVDNTVPGAPVTYRFNDLFDTTFSNASSGTIESRISRTETITSSATAEDQAFRNIASAYTALADLGLDSLNDDARKAVTDLATTQLKSAGDRIITLRADVGTKLARIDASNSELVRQQDIAAKTVSSLEEVDITEAGLRVNALKTQLEAAYTVTGKLQNLSILNYI